MAASSSTAGCTTAESFLFDTSVRNTAVRRAIGTPMSIDTAVPIMDVRIMYNIP